MRSLLVEYLRFDPLETGILQAGKDYLRLVGSKPVGMATTTVQHRDLLIKLSALRYQSSLSVDEKWAHIKELSHDIKDFIVNLKSVDEFPTQIDLVLNASELGLLPFELLLRDDGSPYFASRDNKLVLTRRIRQEFVSKEENWPIVPKVLFAYGNPEYGSFRQVPFEQHLNKLKWALRPWITNEGENEVLTVVPNASFQEITTALQQADQNRPFTHLHLLAHGMMISDPITGDGEYGVALNSKQKEPTKVEAFSDLIKSMTNKPFIVSYMVCDSGNFTSPIRAEKNIVQVTHAAGVPIVVGSQLPFSYDGSEQVTEDFYGAIMSGKDVREALHEARCNLYDKIKDSHDWLGLVSYVRLPEGYEDYLQDSILNRELASLKTIRENSNLLIESDAASKDDYLDMIFLLNQRIKVLENHYEKLKDQKIKHGVFEENAGLLGSGYKRLAELTYFKDKIFESDPQESLNKQKTLLEHAKEWYKKAADYNLSHHWSLVQYLSLDYVINSKITRPDYWQAAYLVTKNAIESDSKEIWAYGSLIELYLLSSENDWTHNKKPIEDAINRLIKQVETQSKNDDFPIVSTRQQLKRYTTWWTEENGYNVNANLKTEIEKLIKMLS